MGTQVPGTVPAPVKMGGFLIRKKERERERERKKEKERKDFQLFLKVLAGIPWPSICWSLRCP